MLKSLPMMTHFFKNGDAQSVDCAWLDGNCAVYTSDSKKAALNYTTDGGAVWNTITRLPEKSEGGSVAMSADGKTIIWKPASISGKPYVTPDYGENWYYCEGISYGAKVIADRVNPKTFYATCEERSTSRPTAAITLNRQARYSPTTACSRQLVTRRDTSGQLQAAL